MNPEQAVDPQAFVEYRLVRLAERLRRRFDAAVRPHVLTTPQSMGAIIDQLETAGFLQSRPRRGRGVPAPTELSAAGEKALAEAAAQVRALDTKTRQHLGEDYNVLMQILDVWESLPDEPTTGRPRSLSQKDL
jgi:DNA-binding MarR family transcriptional regulator